ncbi:hypothetical protein ACQP1W_33790 [Spirillospora sp. CA-255316]
MTSRPRAGFRLRVAVGLMVVASATGLAGCGEAEKGAASRGGSPAAKTAGGSPTPASVRASSTPQAAADGTNLRACKDGTCEVKVTRPVSIRTDVRKLKISAVKVTSLKGEEISFEFTLPSSGEFDFSCDADPRCQTMVVGPAFGSPGTGRTTAHPGALIHANGITVRVVTATKESAILRMKPRKS